MIKTYPERITFYTEKRNELKRKSRLLALIRLVVFILISGGVYFFWDSGFAMYIVLFGIIGFLRLVVINTKVNREVQLMEAFIELNKNEIQAENKDFSFANDGIQFHNPKHPYSNDFDLFGPNSVFQYLNRTVTDFGENTLAHWLQFPELEKKKILEYQNSTKELSEELDWRQHFSAIAKMNLLSVKDQERLNHWGNNQEEWGDNIIFKVILYALPILTILNLFLVSFGLVSWSFFGYALLIPLGVVGGYLKKINAEYNQISNMVLKLEVLARVSEKVEQTEFKSELLKEWQQQLSWEGTNASVRIKELKNLLNLFENRSNILIGIVLNAFFLWDIQLMVRMLKWRKENGAYIHDIWEVVGRFDAMNSLANLVFNRKELVYPVISEEEYYFKGKGLGHLLIDPVECVGNDYEIIGKGSIHIVTGANMAGKSTFLRTVGLQMVLGRMGLPVLANEFEFSPMPIFSSMRTEDDLSSHTSFFYAELSRLARISDELKKGERRFIILDEILKGTNSVDKAKGSYAFVEKIIQYNLMGIIATHDLSLCELAEKYPQRISNKAFEVTFEGQNLKFDYTLRDGICQNMNASFLLKQMGIVDDY